MVATSSISATSQYDSFSVGDGQEEVEGEQGATEQGAAGLGG